MLLRYIILEIRLAAMKKIDIIGKRNQDRMKQKIDPNTAIEKKTTKNSKCIDEIYYSDQSLGLSLLKEYNPEIISSKKISPKDDKTEALKHIVREIENKRKAYIYQDKLHSIYDDRYTISLEQTITLIQESELYCHYCRENCMLTYKEVMCRKQWTLDRIDNNYGHNHTNVVIACLDCNLKRGNMDSERFRMGKQFTFQKLE